MKLIGLDSLLKTKKAKTKESVLEYQKSFKLNLEIDMASRDF